MKDGDNRKTIAQIREELNHLPPERLEEGINTYLPDERAGVRKLVESAAKRLDAYKKETERIEQMCQYEKEYSDYTFVCGIDEVGRGPLAGPVVAGAVILPKECRILYVNDSKKLSAAKREELCEIIRREAVSVGIGMVQQDVIDEVNILNATYEAMRLAIANLTVSPDLLLNDAVTIPGLSVRQVPLVKGDAKSISIASASIVAKVFRDRMMVEYDNIYPGYGFASNKGYGSKDHIEALRCLGPCPIHRKSFIKNIV
jgi:ribonuclease HII